MKKRLKPLALILPGALLLVGAPLGIATATAAEQNASSSYTAEETFEAVFFGQGDLAAELTTARSVEFVEQTPAEVKAQDAILADFEAAHPGAIEAFHETASTGTVAQTRAAIVETSQDLAAVTGIDTSQVKADSGAQCLIWAVAAAVAISVWVYVDIDVNITQSDPYPNYQMASVPTDGSLALDKVALALNTAV